MRFCRSSHTDSACSRRRLLGGAAAVAAGALGGCVTTDLSVSAPGVGDSAVFESFSLVDSMSWGAPRARVTATLRPAATTERGVRRLTVVTESGSAYWSGAVDAGQSSETVSVPVGSPVTLFAENADHETVGRQRVSVRGRSVP
ncbi:MAG: hypothetical protein ABEJ04_07885 [Halobacteriaceae archaeon]